MTNEVATTTDNKGVAKAAPKTIKEMLSDDRMKAQFAAALPAHLKPERFVRVALTALTRTPGLAKCDQASFFQSLLTLSQLGLEPDGRLAHLIPFENRKRGVTECQLIVDYKGIVKLVNQSGDVSGIHADVVCENDSFEYNMGVVTAHKIDFRKPRGPMYAVWCVIRMKDGTAKYEVMSKQDVDSIRARSRAGQSGPWCTDYNEMAKKTVFKRASKWVPWSPEVRAAIDADNDFIDIPATTRKAAQSLDDIADAFTTTAEKEEVIDIETGEIMDGQQESAAPTEMPKPPYWDDLSDNVFLGLDNNQIGALLIWANTTNATKAQFVAKAKATKDGNLI